jgi:predicted ABC-type transport system involved in lysophospholipase L1 biosynthesis ATPase subunit
MINNMNPYVGLRTFEMDESILFFGRSEQILQLLQRLHQHRFVSVVGSSGCGKSSLLKAGLIPALKAGYLVDDSDRWFIAIMKPGQNPLYNLAEALLKQTDPGSTEEQVLSLVKKIDAEGTDVLVNLLLSQQKKQHLNFIG